MTVTALSTTLAAPRATGDALAVDIAADDFDRELAVADSRTSAHQDREPQQREDIGRVDATDASGDELDEAADESAEPGQGDGHPDQPSEQGDDESADVVVEGGHGALLGQSTGANSVQQAPAASPSGDYAAATESAQPQYQAGGPGQQQGSGDPNGGGPTVFSLNLVGGSSSASPTGDGQTGGAAPSGAQQTLTIASTLNDQDQANVARVVRGVNNAVNQQGGSVTLRLHPPELGAVRIELQIADGNVRAAFATEHASVRMLLNHQMSQLRNALELQGLHVERLNVLTTQAQDSTTDPRNDPRNDPRQDSQQGSGSPSDGRSRGAFDQSADQQDPNQPPAARRDGRRERPNFEQALNATA